MTQTRQRTNVEYASAYVPGWFEISRDPLDLTGEVEKWKHMLEVNDKRMKDVEIRKRMLGICADIKPQHKQAEMICVNPGVYDSSDEMSQASIVLKDDDLNFVVYSSELKYSNLSDGDYPMGLVIGSRLRVFEYTVDLRRYCVERKDKDTRHMVMYTEYDVLMTSGERVNVLSAQTCKLNA